MGTATGVLSSSGETQTPVDVNAFVLSHPTTACFRCPVSRSTKLCSCGGVHAPSFLGNQQQRTDPNPGASCAESQKCKMVRMACLISPAMTPSLKNKPLSSWWRTGMGV